MELRRRRFEDFQVLEHLTALLLARRERYVQKKCSFQGREKRLRHAVVKAIFPPCSAALRPSEGLLGTGGL